MKKKSILNNRLIDKETSISNPPLIRQNNKMASLLPNLIFQN